MKYILKNRMPIPCNDKDLWEAWFDGNETTIDEFETEIVKVTAEFTGKPLKIAEEDLENCGGPLVFQVTAVFKDLRKPTQFSFYDSWEDAEKRFQEYIETALKAFH